MAKRFLYKVYSAAGTYLATWADVASDLSYTTAIMSGVGEFVVTLPRKINSFGENSDVAFGNIVKVYVFDEEAPTGVIIATGKITRYVPAIAGKKENVAVHCLGLVHELAEYPYVESGLTTLLKSGLDPSAMFQAVFDAFTGMGGRADYTGPSVSLTGLSETYSFNALSCLDALNAIIALCPSSWYWLIGTDNTAYLQAKAAVADHTIVIGKSITKFKAEKNIESVVNRIYFTGGVVPTTYTDQVQLTQDTTVPVGNGTNFFVTQSFVAAKSSISGVRLYKAANTGTPAGVVLLTVRPDRNGQPDNVVLGQADITTAWDAGAVGALDFELPATTLVAGQKYWLTLEEPSSAVGNHRNTAKIAASAYASGQFGTGTTATAWAFPGGDLYFQTYFPANLFKVYDHAASQTSWGLHAIFKQDERVTVVASMDQIAQAVFDAKSIPEIRMTIGVPDSNGNPLGYDIESLKPGQAILVRNLVDSNYSKWDIAVWDVAYWDQSLGNVQELLGQIQSVAYTPDMATIQISNRPPRIAETVEQIQRDLKAAKVNNNPSAPST